MPNTDNFCPVPKLHYTKKSHRSQKSLGLIPSWIKSVITGTMCKSKIRLITFGVGHSQTYVSDRAPCLKLAATYHWRTLNVDSNQILPRDTGVKGLKFFGPKSRISFTSNRSESLLKIFNDNRAPKKNSHPLFQKSSNFEKKSLRGFFWNQNFLTFFTKNPEFVNFSFETVL